MLLFSSSTAARRFGLIVGLLLVAGLAEAVFNHLNDRGLADAAKWVFPATVSTLGAPGDDLRVLRHGADQMVHGIDPYGREVAYPPPPFAACFFYPFSLMAERQAYVVQYWMLLTLNLASIGLVVGSLVRAGGFSGVKDGVDFSGPVLGAVVMLLAINLQFHGYGLEFALERGNFDSYVLFFASASIASMVFAPERIWLPVVLLSAATHLKIYPAILLALPLLQHRRRAVGPIILVNVAMLFAFGPANAWSFLRQIGGYMQRPYVWAGNHSIASYVAEVIVPAFSSPRESPWLVRVWSERLLSALLGGSWLFGMYRLREVRLPARRWLAMAALSFPPMGFFSSVSHDYKLVIYIVPVLVNLYFFAETYLADGAWASLVGLVLTLVAGVALGHSTVVGDWPLSETKFPALVLLMLVSCLQASAGAGRSILEESRTDAQPNRREFLVMAAWLAVIAVAAAVHLGIKARGVRLGRMAAAQVTGRRPLPFVPPPEAGYGALALTLKLPGTAAAIAEPILVCGRTGNATMVYARLLPGSRMKVGVEFWGKGSAESEVFEVPGSDAQVAMTCALPCLLAPAGQAKGLNPPGPEPSPPSRHYSIVVDGVERLAGTIQYVQPPQPPIYYGENPLGGSLVSSEFTGTIMMAVRL